MHLGINDIKELISSMEIYPDMDFSGYSFSFLKRRLTMISRQHALKSKQDFISNLQSKHFRDEILTQMSVENTEMFRDPSFWNCIQEQVFKKLPGDCHYIWLPRETNGEEAFSLSILLLENDLQGKYKIICNTPSEKNYQKINLGITNPLHHEINQGNFSCLNIRSDYGKYVETRNGQQFVPEIVRGQVECRVGNYNITDPSHQGKVGLILFRNVSVYFNRQLAENCYRFLVNNLIPGGFIAIGLKEELPRSIKEELIAVNDVEKIYQKPIYSNTKINVELKHNL